MTAEEIRALRTAVGMTQEKFAHEIGVTVSSVNSWETGKREPSPLACREMARLAEERLNGGER